MKLPCSIAGLCLLLCAGCQSVPPVRERVSDSKTVTTVRMQRSGGSWRPHYIVDSAPDCNYNTFTQSFERPWPFGPLSTENNHY